MKSVKGTLTEQNLLKSFAGESQARNRYTLFASKAAKEGYQLVSSVFTETANQEKEHAERFFSFLEGGVLKIEATFPSGVVGTTVENLTASKDGENEEATVLYVDFAKTAKSEGFTEVANLYEKVIVAESYHEKRFAKLLELIKSGAYFKANGDVVWRCRNCGYLHTASSAPDKCPACLHAQSYFEQMLGGFL